MKAVPGGNILDLLVPVRSTPPITPVSFVHAFGISILLPNEYLYDPPLLVFLTVVPAARVGPGHGAVKVIIDSSAIIQSSDLRVLAVSSCVYCSRQSNTFI